MPANSANTKRPNKWLYGSIAIVALVAGLLLARTQHVAVQKPTLEAATLLLPPKLISMDGLVDHNGKPFTQQQLQGRFSFIFFGYTHCPDVCPATLYQFKTIAKMLHDKPELDARTQFILVSVDPQRDKPGQLKEYVHYYNPDFIGVTGSPDSIQKFSRQMGVIYERREAEDGNQDNYLVDHSSAILMTNPSGQLQVIYSAPHQAETLLKDYQAIYRYLDHQS